MAEVERRLIAARSIGAGQGPGALVARPFARGGMRVVGGVEPIHRLAGEEPSRARRHDHAAPDRGEPAAAAQSIEATAQAGDRSVQDECEVVGRGQRHRADKPQESSLVVGQPLFAKHPRSSEGRRRGTLFVRGLDAAGELQTLDGSQPRALLGVASERLNWLWLRRYVRPGPVDQRPAGRLPPVHGALATPLSGGWPALQAPAQRPLRVSGAMRPAPRQLWAEGMWMPASITSIRSATMLVVPSQRSIRPWSRISWLDSASCARANTSRQTIDGTWPGVPT